MIHGKYVKKPIPIDAVEIQTIAQLERLDADGIVSWRHGQDGRIEIFNSKTDHWLPCSFGDVLNVSDPADIYAIPREVFERTYQAAA